MTHLMTPPAATPAARAPLVPLVPPPSDFDLDPLLKRLHLANTRRVWRELLRRAEQEGWTYEYLLTVFARRLSMRPRKTLGLMTPAEKLASTVALTD